MKKSSDKSIEKFNSHCVGSFAIASELVECKTPKEKITIIDDTYRLVRRRLHDTQFSKGGVRHKYFEGNFKGIKKGSICEFGQIVGGTKNTTYIRNNANKRIGKNLKKINWLFHSFKIKKLNNSAIPPMTEVKGILASNKIIMRILLIR
ncbi:MAG: hypothetical protein ACP5D2_02780 [Candidatus Nanoarchaeia archaeon]